MYRHWNSVFCQPKPASVIFFRSRAVVRSLPHRKTFIPYSGLAARSGAPAGGAAVRACCDGLLAVDDPAELDGLAAAWAAARAAASGSAELDGAAAVEACPAAIFSKPSLKFEPGRSPARAIPVPAEFWYCR